MSKNFNVYPSKKTIVKCSDLIKDTLDLFNNLCERVGIDSNLEITAREVKDGCEIIDSPQYLSNNENSYIILNINDIGEIYVFYHKHLDLDIAIWKEEIDTNPNAKKIKQLIRDNLQLGYFWSVKKTMGQPFLVEVLYGCVAISIARIVGGFIFSDDGAWKPNVLPMDCLSFERAFFDGQEMKNKQFIEQIKKIIAL